MIKGYFIAYDRIVENIITGRASHMVFIYRRGTMVAMGRGASCALALREARRNWRNGRPRKASK